MLPLKFTKDQTVIRLRWVMFGAIIVDILNRLAGQPGSFWHHAQSAIRGDGLSINNPTNHMFEFFLGSGWLAYLLSSATYLFAVFIVVSVLPRKMALLTIFSVIFGHYYDASNWLAVRWHLGMEGPFIYGLALSAGLVFAGFSAKRAGEALKSLRWIMLIAMLADVAVTLRGQPANYWHDPGMVDEGNQVSRFFLMHGWYSYLLEQAIICLAVYRLISLLPKSWGLTIALCFTFAGFTGTSNWFFYRWILGMEAPVIFGIILSSAIVLFTFSPGRKSWIMSETADTDTGQDEALTSVANKNGWLLGECN